ncbi:MAG: hypothetical protein IKX37_03320 [Bacteroidales bacterium]|nr:hypothetical protein [Bacteroidales bacterium]
MKPIIFCMSMLLSLFGCQGGYSAGGEKPEGSLRSYEYRESRMRISPAEYYLLQRTEEGEMQLTWAKDASDGTIIRVADDALEQVESMVQAYKLNRLKENYRPIGHVLDGTMWNVYFRYEKGSVSSGGDNAWPGEKLWNGVEAINAYLNTLIDAATEADVVGTVSNRDL